MTARDHTAYSDEIGAYLLGALTDTGVAAVSNSNIVRVGQGNSGH